MHGSAHRPEEAVDICTFYHSSRLDSLSKRLVRGDDMELTEEYVGRQSDGMVSMHVTFGMAKKEFGPADGKGGAKEVCRKVRTKKTLETVWNVQKNATLEK